MRFWLIDVEKDHHDVSLLARVLGVSRQGYYAWAARQGRGPSARGRRDAELTEQIRRHHQASDEIYGSPRIHGRTARAGWGPGGPQASGPADARRRAGRSEPAQGLRTTVADPCAAAASDLVRRRFCADEPNRIWTADITYVPTWQDFVYLAVVLDVFSRRIVGWAMVEHMRTELVTDALRWRSTSAARTPE
ncbi:integrase-like protein [Nonomuraea polychroma]|uniref:Integrase-like protein n=1 Tax=Nonomuraea polychroma TaxID=46176 RepID=A0A438M854_9ACTN|nr:DDE-type integrase/transposase/recombinase [Nonomuraea polychroma]RVX41900.1 integrase-like protein [Nonomuraea polychroma]